MEAKYLRCKAKLAGHDYTKKITQKENNMLEELKEPIATLEEDIKNVWGRL